jgi:hypothetical protein
MVSELRQLSDEEFDEEFFELEAELLALDGEWSWRREKRSIGRLAASCTVKRPA